MELSIIFIACFIIYTLYMLALFIVAVKNMRNKNIMQCKFISSHSDSSIGRENKVEKT